MAEEPRQDDEEQLRTVALETATSIRRARQRAEDELAAAKHALEARTAELEKALAERAAAEADQQKALMQLRLLHQVTATALGNLPLEKLFENLLSRVCEAVGCDIAIVFMLNAETNELDVAARFGPRTETLAPLRVRVGESVAGRVAAERKATLVRNAADDQSVRPALRALGVQTVLAIPLIARDHLIGVLEVASFADREFTGEDMDFILHVANQVAIAIENSSLYESAREANRLKDRFLSIASHELKTPLHALLGWTELLRTIDNDELRARAIEGIERAARNQATLVEDMLDASRVREGKLVLQPAPMDLCTVVSNAAKTLQTAADKKQVRLEVTVPETPVIIVGDAARLRQVVWNLLANAVKFTPAGKGVLLRLETSDNMATIVVEDEGDGISPEFLPRLFGALQQEEKGTSAGGLGLGLFIVKTIVNLHGGTITAHSEGQGRGAAFTVKLPVDPGSPPG